MRVPSACCLVANVCVRAIVRSDAPKCASTCGCYLRTQIDGERCDAIDANRFARLAHTQTQMVKRRISNHCAYCVVHVSVCVCVWQLPRSKQTGALMPPARRVRQLSGQHLLCYADSISVCRMGGSFGLHQTLATDHKRMSGNEMQMNSHANNSHRIV